MVNPQPAVPGLASPSGYDDGMVLALLADVMDPEAGIGIVDMGLVYRFATRPGEVSVDVTMTSPACPMGAMIVDDIRTALEAGLPASTRIDVRLVWEPPWTPARMSEAARRHLGWDEDQ